MTKLLEAPGVRQWTCAYTRHQSKARRWKTDGNRLPDLIIYNQAWRSLGSLFWLLLKGEKSIWTTRGELAICGSRLWALVRHHVWTFTNPELVFLTGQHGIQVHFYCCKAIWIRLMLRKALYKCDDDDEYELTPLVSTSLVSFWTFGCNNNILLGVVREVIFTS